MRPTSPICGAAAVLLAALVGTRAGVRAAGSDVLPFHATERTLANGLKVIVVPTGFPNLVSIDIPAAQVTVTPVTDVFAR